MKNVITLLSLTALLTACGGSETETATTVAGTPNIVTIAASPDVLATTDTPIAQSTAELKSSVDFDFATSRSIAIDFDIEQAKTSQGLMSVCSDYTELDGMYDINYDSCSLQAPLVNGVYNGEMEVTNDINTVVGVVWFKDSNIDPVYIEFALEAGSRVARRGSGDQTLVWR